MNSLCGVRKCLLQFFLAGDRDSGRTLPYVFDKVPELFMSTRLAFSALRAQSGAAPTGWEDSRRDASGVTGSVIEYFSKHHRARKPSFQPIFLPSS